MNGQRGGFSTIELLMITVIVGILSVIAFPKVSRLSRSASLHSATQTVATTLSQARASAIQSGRETRFVRSYNTVLVTVDRPGGVDTVFAPRDLYAEHGVTLGGPAVIQFNARGFADGSSRNEAIVVSNGEKEQSVCILGLGKISIRSCP